MEPEPERYNFAKISVTVNLLSVCQIFMSIIAWYDLPRIL